MYLGLADSTELDSVQGATLYIISPRAHILNQNPRGAHADLKA